MVSTGCLEVFTVGLWHLTKQEGLKEDEDDQFFKCPRIVRPPILWCDFGHFTEESTGILTDNDTGHTSWPSGQVPPSVSGQVAGVCTVWRPRQSATCRVACPGDQCGQCPDRHSLQVEPRHRGVSHHIAWTGHWVWAHSGGSYFPMDVNADLKAFEGMARGQL